MKKLGRIFKFLVPIFSILVLLVSITSILLVKVIPPASAAQIGSKKMGVFLVTFADNRRRSLSVDTVNQDVFTGTNSMNSFLQKSSNGLFSINGDVIPMDLYGNTTCDLDGIPPLTPGALPQGVVSYAIDHGIDLSQYPYRMIVLDPSINCGGEQGKENFPWAYSVGENAMAHEFGHLMGLAHAGSYDCHDQVVYNSCDYDEYGNFMDIMGSSNSYFGGDYGPFAKEYLGWLQGSQIATDNGGGGTYTFERYESLPGSPGPSYPTKVLKIPTMYGPVYYVAYRQSVSGISGVTVELDARNVGYRRTGLLDLTPGNAAGVDDFKNGYLADGAVFMDPYNGITLKGISHNGTNATIQVTHFTPVGFGYLPVSFAAPAGYLSAVGQKKDINWSPVHYIVDVQCTGGFGCTGQWNQWNGCSAWPTGACPPIDTTNTSVDIPVGSSGAGYTYYYRVWILTRDDNNPSQMATYVWQGPGIATSDCGGAASCTKTLSWPVVTYKGNLYERDTGADPCIRQQVPGLQVGCSSSFVNVQNGSTYTYRGLPTGINFKGEVHITDFGGFDHKVAIYDDLGQSDNYFRSCSSSTAFQCTISPLSFIGAEPVMWTTKVNGPNGLVLNGPTGQPAFTDGSLTIGWGPAWNYSLVAFPNNYSDCYSAGGACQVQNLQSGLFFGINTQFNAVSAYTNYHLIICVNTCNPPPGSGNSKIVDTTINSLGNGLGNNFPIGDPWYASVPPFNPAIDTDGDGCYDGRENGTDWRQGGQRDRTSPWDFTDVPVPAITSTNVNDPDLNKRPHKDKVVTLQDAIAVNYYVGTKKGGPPNIHGVRYDDDLNQNGIPDGMEYDRTPTTNPLKPWLAGPPNGSVTLQDVLVINSQVGTNCN